MAEGALCPLVHSMGDSRNAKGIGSMASRTLVLAPVAVARLRNRNLSLRMASSAQAIGIDGMRHRWRFHLRRLVAECARQVASTVVTHRQLKGRPVTG